MRQEVPNSDRHRWKAQMALGVLILIVLPFLGLFVTAAVLWLVQSLEPSLWNPLVSDTSLAALPTALRAYSIAVIAVAIVIAMWIAFFAWKQWVKRSKMSDAPTRIRLMQLKLPEEMEKRRGPAWTILMQVTILTLAAEGLGRWDIALSWIPVGVAVVLVIRWLARSQRL